MPLNAALSLPGFGEGRVGFFLPWLAALADPTPPSPKPGREKKDSPKTGSEKS
jgi:hypothetical protein